ncbi:MAG: citrate synthase [Planctomycetes bacterium]|nr:citrate synthase [Planctomycetota bacterium]
MEKAGLEGVVASDSAVSHVDGQAGRLVYRGYEIQDLAANCSFEEAAYLVWRGELPTAPQLDGLRRTLAAHRPLSEQMAHLLSELPASAPPMSVLRTCVSVIGLSDPRAESPEAKVNLDMAQELTAQAASIVASIHRIRRGLPPVRPEPGLSHAANFLYMLRGTRPDALAEEVFDDCLVLHIDHGFNASTFTARVIASTLSDLYSAVTGAIGALRGPLHGGANQQVLLMLQDIGHPARAAEYVKALLAAKKKVMGFGHRVYKTGDPRAAILRRWCRVLGERLGQTQWADISATIEQVMADEKGLDCNVDFYSASVYHMLGIPGDLFTPIFAISRVVGWTAHILEQYANNRLIRPLSNYTGPVDRTVAPISERRG